MKQFLLTMAGVVAGMTIFFIGVPFLIIVAALGSAKPLPSAAVLELDLRSSLPDQDPQSPFLALGGKSLSVMSVIESLRRAETDSRVKGLFVRLPEGGISPGEADELRGAFKRFRAAGKPVFAHSQGLYPSGAAPSTYMLGASADQLWLQPGATLEAPGLASEEMFFKRLFDKYGVKADYQQRYEYKNAVNPYLYDDFTPAHREAQLSWMNAIYQGALANAASDRKKTPVVLKQALEAGPHPAQEAQSLGLVDQVGQVKDAQDALLRRAGRGAKLQNFSDYASSVRRERAGGGPKIAVVFAEGAIITGTNDTASVFGGEQNIYSDDTAKAIYDAIDDKDVKAIVFRVSSPGGADTASEQILAAVRAAKAAGKPVVVSMGEYAASGGYWISSQASAIVAQPSTLTGSIGVYGGKLALGQTFSHFGVDVRQLSVGGPDAGAYSIGQEFTAQQRAAFAHSIDLVYDGFIDRVSSGRKLKPERVREIAKGRVWTGAQARGLGLVDELGGFYDAVERAKSLAGLKGQDVRLKRMTAPMSPFGALGRAFSADADSMASLARVGRILSEPQARGVMDRLTEARLRTQGANLLAPLPSW
jgi:protease-4